MNRYSIEDICVGMEESFSVKITQEMMNKFTEISGDINPLHVNQDYAITKGYQGKVVYGMLTASFYSTLAGVYLPGENCLLYSVKTKFNNPVYIDDELLITGVISDVNLTVNCIEIKAKIKNQKGNIVSVAKILAGVK